MIRADFSRYEPLSAFPSSGESYHPPRSRGFGLPNLHLPGIGVRGNSPIADVMFGNGGSTAVNTSADSENKEIRVSPTAHVVSLKKALALHQDIDPNVRATFEDYDYYRVEFGFNVILDKGVSIDPLTFWIQLEANGKVDEEGVSFYDAFPNDSVELRKIASGKFAISLSKALKLIPVAGTLAADVIDASVSSEFNWNSVKSRVQCSGPLDTKVTWRIDGGDLAGKFNPVVVVKVKRRPPREHITATVTAKYKLVSGRLLGKHTSPELATIPPKVIPILTS